MFLRWAIGFGMRFFTTNHTFGIHVTLFCSVTSALALGARSRILDISPRLTKTSPCHMDKKYSDANYLNISNYSERVFESELNKMWIIHFSKVQH